MTKSTVELQLEKILKGEVEQVVNAQPDDVESEENLEIQELVPVVYEPKESVAEVESKDLSDDYKFARSNLYGLIGRTNAALDLALKISAASEHPRALEVVATLINTSSSVSKELLSLHDKIEKPKKGNPQNPDGQYTQINNYNNYQAPKEQEEKSVNDILDGLGDENDNKNRKTKKKSS